MITMGRLSKWFIFTSMCISINVFFLNSYIPIITFWCVSSVLCTEFVKQVRSSHMRHHETNAQRKCEWERERNASRWWIASTIKKRERKPRKVATEQARERQSERKNGQTERGVMVTTATPTYENTKKQSWWTPMEARKGHTYTHMQI